MKRLGLLRHAKSEWDDLAQRDFDRGLNSRGRRGAALMGRHAREQGDRWEVIVASPAERVRRTLEVSGIEGPVTWERQAYLADAPALLSLLRAVPGDPVSVLLVAHNPGLHDLLFQLISERWDDAALKEAAGKFPTAAYAVLELTIERWDQCRPGCARLTHFTRPRDLDPTLGTES